MALIMKHSATRQPLVPDLLQPGLKLVFCGTAPGRMSAEKVCYYAYPQNKFWRTLHAVGLTPRLLAPAEYPELLVHGIGLTDIAKYVSGQDNQLPKRSLGAAAILALRKRMLRFQPKILAFTSLEGGRRFLGHKATFGAQPETIGATHIWILPSPSPKAHWNWNERLWRELSMDVKKMEETELNVSPIPTKIQLAG
jgi:TDG/mug DNA glycosylase family protein